MDERRLLGPWAVWMAVIASGLAVPSSARASMRGGMMASAPTEDTEWLEVVVDEKMLQSEEHRGWVLVHGSAVLRARETPLGPKDRIIIELRGNAYDYRVRITLVRNGRVLDGQPEPFLVEGPSVEMLDRIEVAVAEAADVLAAEPAEIEEPRAGGASGGTQTEPAPGDEGTGNGAEDQDETGPIVEDGENDEHTTPKEDRLTELELKRARRRHKKIRVAGTTLAAAGGATLVSGIAMAAAGRTDFSADARLQRNWRPPGYGLIGVGAPLLVAGVSLLVWNAVRCRKDSARCGQAESPKTAKYQITPLAEPRVGGVVVSGRF